MSKKIIIGIIVVIAILAVVVGAVLLNNNNENKQENHNLANTDKKILVAYFSYSGNTEIVAKEIQNQVGGDLFEIKRKGNYSNVSEEAKDEIEDKKRPELEEKLDSIEDYDIIFVGYPIWNADVPPIINSFLEEYNFDGKTVVPFCTHGGSGLSGTPTTIANKIRNANVITNGFSISRSNMENSISAVESWLKEIYN